MPRHDYSHIQDVKRPFVESITEKVQLLDDTLFKLLADQFDQFGQTQGGIIRVSFASDSSQNFQA